MTAEDFRALMPLIYGHISPYGTFLLDMASRLDIEPPVITLPREFGQNNLRARRQSGLTPQNASNGTQQLALFNALL